VQGFDELQLSNRAAMHRSNATGVHVVLAIRQPNSITHDSSLPLSLLVEHLLWLVIGNTINQKSMPATIVPRFTSIWEETSLCGERVHHSRRRIPAEGTFLHAELSSKRSPRELPSQAMRGYVL